jgi:hypothetical protein
MYNGAAISKMMFNGAAAFSSAPAAPYVPMNMVFYDPITYTEWGGSITKDSSGITITHNGSSQVEAYLANTTFKASTKYGLLLNVQSNTSTTALILKNQLTGTFTEVVSPGAVGNFKLVFTTQATISVNALSLYSTACTNGLITKLRSVQAFELPAGTTVESDFATLTADQLNAKYSYAVPTNELPYDPITWAEWTTVVGTKTIVGGSLIVENNATNLVIDRMSLSLKPSTKYGILCNVPVNTRVAGTETYFCNGSTAYPFSPDKLIPPGTTGNFKEVMTSNATITSNQYRIAVLAGNGRIEIRSVRIFELPVGSELEWRFNNLTADQLNTLYPASAIEYTNLVTNGDFSNGLTGWTSTNVTSLTTSNNEATFQSSFTNGRIEHTVPTVATHKYYVTAKLNGPVTGFVYANLPNITKNKTSAGIYEKVSFIGTASGSSISLEIGDNAVSGTTISTKEIMCVDLTVTFGAGNEPSDLSWCHAYLPFVSSTGTIPTVPYTNALSNGDFENNFIGWVYSSPAAVTTAASKHGTKSCGWANVTSDYHGITQTAAVPAAHKVYVSYWYNMPVLTSGGIYATISDGSGTTLGYVDPNDAVTSGWVKISDIFTLAAGKSDISLMIGTTNCTGTVYVDAVMVVDLTAKFGASAEPNKAWCDTNITNDNTAWANPIIVWDDFDRASNSSSLGNAVTGQTWNPWRGTWGIDNKKAILSSTTTEGAAVINTGLTNNFYMSGDMKITKGPSDYAFGGFALKGLDANNYLYFRVFQYTSLQPYKCINGAGSNLTAAPSYTFVEETTYNFRFEVVGKNITVKINSATIGTVVIPDDIYATIGSGTYAGMYSHNTLTQFDNFSIGQL